MEKIKAYLFDLGDTLIYYNGNGADAEKYAGKHHDELLIKSSEDVKMPAEQRKRFNQKLNSTGIHLFYDSEEFIQKLKNKGYSLGIVSNLYKITAERVRKELKHFIKNFDAVSISSEIEYAKPGHQIFRHDLALLGVRPEKALMVGDRKDMDIIPAKEIGLNTILIDRTKQTLCGAIKLE